MIPSLSEASPGIRDRETCLHLAFLSWYGIVEPEHITGFTDSYETQDKLLLMFADVHEHFTPAILGDAELLFVIGLPASMFWFHFTNSATWQQRGDEYRRQYRKLAPNGIDPGVFDGRGALGCYYQRQASVKNSF